jgi:probable phosphoglycerate mutase
VETLFLARHALAGSNRDGTASSRAPGEGLTEAGREQARRLGAQLSGEPIELGMATPFRRTQETLALALAGRGVPRAVVAELGEIRFGAFDGGPLADYREWAASSSPSAPAPGGGESRAQAAARFARGLELVLARPERTVLVVRYVLDAARGLVPAARMEAVEHAVPARLSATEVAAAAELLAGWSLAPRFRAPSDGG